MISRTQEGGLHRTDTPHNQQRHVLARAERRRDAVIDPLARARGTLLHTLKDGLPARSRLNHLADKLVGFGGKLEASRSSTPASLFGRYQRIFDTPGQGCRAATSASVSAPMAPSFFPRRLCRPTCRAHRAGGRWHHSRRCPRDIIRSPEPLHCPADICPVDIFAQRQHVWIARPTLEAIDQEQSSRRSKGSLRRVRGQVSGFVRRCGLTFRSPGTTCRSIRRLRDSQNTCCLMGGRASLPVAADRRRGARSGR